MKKGDLIEYDKTFDMEKEETGEKVNEVDLIKYDKSFDKEKEQSNPLSPITLEKVQEEGNYDDKEVDIPEVHIYLMSLFIKTLIQEPTQSLQKQAENVINTSSKGLFQQVNVNINEIFHK